MNTEKVKKYITAELLLDSALDARRNATNLDYPDEPITYKEIEEYAYGTDVIIRDNLIELICIAHERFCEAAKGEYIYAGAWHQEIKYPLSYIELEFLSDLYEAASVSVGYN